MSKLSAQFQYVATKLEDALKNLEDNALVKELCENMDVRYLECIAQVRFGLCMTAQYLHSYLNEKNIEHLNHEEKDCLAQVIEKVKGICQDRCVKTEPRFFFAKQIVRQFGFPSLLKLSRHSLLKSWIIPVGLEANVQVHLYAIEKLSDCHTLIATCCRVPWLLNLQIFL